MGRRADETRAVKGIRVVLANCWGEHEYSIRFWREKGDDWPKVVFQFERQGKEGEILKYRIENAGGEVRCSCPDLEGHKLPCRCKHVGFLRHLLGGLEDLFRVWETPGGNNEYGEGEVPKVSGRGWKLPDRTGVRS